MTLDLQPLTVAAGQVAAALHAASGLHETWDAAAINGLLASGGNGLLASIDGIPAGFVLWRVAADEAEILTICTAPEHRRAGAGRLLLEGARNSLRLENIAQLFLEVAVDNAPAIALYRAFGFAETGLRPGYYVRRDGAIDALVMALTL
ncbi:MAG TPA: GNAT family N-acetyltransferase [Alphaproteobacteria bacterium]|nr:GNAT family N-acetyltransferase [Alphaproteobacteria bacterium]